MPYGAMAHIGLAKEVAFGTPVAATEYLPFVSESLSLNIEELLEESIKSMPDEPASHSGLQTIAGDIVFEVRPETVGHILRSCLGVPVTTGAAAPYTHTFTPVNSAFLANCDLPPYTIEVHRDLEQAFQYTGCVVNQLQLAFGTEQKIMRGTASIIAKDVANIAKTTPNFETGAPFKWNQVTVKAGAVTIETMEQAQITINNNLAGFAGLNATDKINKIRRNGNRVIEVSFTFDAANLDEYNRFKNQTETAFEFNFVAGTNELKITLPKVRYTAFPLNVGGAERLTVAASGKAKYDSATSKAIEIALKNAKASY